MSLDELQLRRQIPLALGPAFFILSAISLRIQDLNPLSFIPEVIHPDHRTTIGTEAWGRSRRSVVRAVGAVGGQGKGLRAAAGCWRRVGAAGVD